MRKRINVHNLHNGQVSVCVCVCKWESTAVNSNGIDKETHTEKFQNHNFD